MKILVAENDDLYTGLYNRMLTKWGHSFDLVSDGKEAVEHAVVNEGKYDICLMDIDMPCMSGYEATKLIRLKTKYFPILGVTGNISIKDKFSECGMDDYLKKPFNIDEVHKKIDELTIKVESIHFKDNSITITKEMPMDKEELQKLIELKKHDLTILTFQPYGHRFVVHKNTQNKISHDIIGKRKKLSEFLDHNEEEPGKVHLYAGNFYSNKQVILPEELKKLAEIEREEMKQYPEKTEFPENPKS